MNTGSDAVPAGMTAPKTDEGPTVAAVAPHEAKQNETPDCRGVRYSDQAMRVIAGEHQAEQYLARLHAQLAAPEELSVIVAFLRGELLHGFCRVLEKSLWRRRHG